MTDVQKQLLIDYAAGRPMALLTRDLRCCEGTLARRVREALAEIDAIAEYQRQRLFGAEAMAAYWKIKYMACLPRGRRKALRGTARWSVTRADQLRMDN